MFAANSALIGESCRICTAAGSSAVHW